MGKKQKKSIVFLVLIVLAIALIIISILTLSKEEKEVEAPKVGALAPNFQLRDLSGNLVALKDVYQKKQVTLVNFWATWCPPCMMEIPEFVRFYDEYKEKDFEILAVNSWDDSSQERIQEFAQKEKMKFPVLLDTDDKIIKIYGIRGVPTTFFVDHNGVIREIFIGMMTYDQLKVRINQYVK